ncbi:MAG: 6-carboxytetrahydropterin synthase [Gemmatimonadetes bacterium]|uniref:6-carboxy-5,6,7,8-tetrahydropterin synthase n=1 Tax=Candidatus Kutchimonas denitrificans TaxID=3056748 RepID=A0AAE4ZCS7_9BACT|nr:6-carboxytetrahydropterin synthase [Gemmatimonadota bacterium]NIR75460.1 6-carboxytetrahydropterin synthase [Candidatus Kutchimonas denitrificans]NIS01774.1 6-carboxytetrahydropterin synthase [Gemmatimonadota bacterium]NIT67555.1 6-carboxytetrahydropterin synthase [Gemmatimonadota bacterium]NIU53429.1 hypothetical protein [Gemmatimonadota bacterium]
MYIPGDGGDAASRTHGHGYTVEAVLESDGLDSSDFVVDFDRFQPHLDRLAGDLDHRLLNDIEAFRDGAPSAERQAEYFFHRLSQVVAREFPNVRVAKVRVVQEPDAWAEFEP